MVKHKNQLLGQDGIARKEAGLDRFGYRHLFSFRERYKETSRILRKQGFKFSMVVDPRNSAVPRLDRFVCFVFSGERLGATAGRPPPYYVAPSSHIAWRYGIF